MTQPERAALTDLSLEGRTGCLSRFLATAVDTPLAELPVIAISGEEPGPTFIAVAGVHGDEYEGPQALWEVAGTLPPSALRGTFVGFPICNPWAFAAGSRKTSDVIDGRDLARSFPGDPTGSPTQRLAAALFAFVIRMNPAVFLDLHSGGVRYRCLPMVGYRRGLGDEARSSEAARAFGVPTLWALDAHAGTFNTETARRGIPTVGVEMTGAGGCREEDVAADREGILNILRWLGMLHDRPAPRVEGSFRQTTDLLSPASGYAVPLRPAGVRVRAGEPVARILSPFGEALDELRAPHPGDVLMMRHLRAITAGEAVCMIARP
jgi:predicted deacylase